MAAQIFKVIRYNSNNTAKDDICVTILDINGLDDNLAVIVDSTMDGEREITSTVPVMDMEQSYDRDWLKPTFPILTETVLSHIFRRVVHTNLLWLTIYGDFKTFASVLNQLSIRFATSRNHPTHFFLVRMGRNVAVGILLGEMIHGDAGFKPDPRWLAILGRLCHRPLRAHMVVTEYRVSASASKRSSINALIDRGAICPLQMEYNGVTVDDRLIRLGGTQSLTTLDDTVDTLQGPREVMKSIARRFNRK